ncbi:metallophosphoesterase family protein [Brevibacillus sp. SYSU BS000544]|uniref:metallophosphoesterase family protein n=1 Tax=Brevibacillus sp. SYSU BS000544 TaxID=3416443 RepID=UPI003CE46D99
MSILVLSDTHGLCREVKQVVSRHQVEHIFHCGDFCINRHQEPFSQMQLVRGNCDSDLTVPEERRATWQGLHIYQTHGHLYGVKSSLLKLHYRAEETGANVVLFGHSHVPHCSIERGVLFLNPGSLQLPRGYSRPTYVLLDSIGKNSTEVRVDVLFFDDQGKRVTDLGGEFQLRT